MRNWDLFGNWGIWGIFNIEMVLIGRLDLSILEIQRGDFRISNAD